MNINTIEQDGTEFIRVELTRGEAKMLLDILAGGDTDRVSDIFSDTLYSDICRVLFPR